jgi:hypothetical protein
MLNVDKTDSPSLFSFYLINFSVSGCNVISFSFIGISERTHIPAQRLLFPCLTTLPVELNISRNDNDPLDSLFVDLIRPCSGLNFPILNPIPPADF